MLFSWSQSQNRAECSLPSRREEPDLHWLHRHRVIWTHQLTAVTWFDIALHWWCHAKTRNWGTSHDNLNALVTHMTNRGWLTNPAMSPVSTQIWPSQEWPGQNPPLIFHRELKKNNSHYYPWKKASSSAPMGLFEFEGVFHTWECFWLLS